MNVVEVWVDLMEDASRSESIIFYYIEYNRLPNSLVKTGFHGMDVVEVWVDLMVDASRSESIIFYYIEYNRFHFNPLKTGFRGWMNVVEVWVDF